MCDYEVSFILINNDASIFTSLSLPDYLEVSELFTWIKIQIFISTECYNAIFTSY